MIQNKIAMRILSLNVWGEGQDASIRWPLLAKAVSQLKPDFAGFQEVFQKDHLELVRSAGSFSNAFITPRKTGLGLLTHGIIEEKNFFLLPFSPLEDYRRHIIFVRARFRSLAVNFFNTHLSWEPEDEKSRDVQADAALGFIRSQKSADLDILTGDLNAVESAPSVQRLLTYFKDTFRAFKPVDRGLTWSYKNTYVLREPDLPERRLDYVLIGGRMANKAKIVNSAVVFDERVDNTWISDHFGMCTDLELDRNG